MPVPITGCSHVRLTVTDIARSRAFHDEVFGFDVAFEMPDGADEATREQLWFLFGGVIYQVPGGLRPAPDGPCRRPVRREPRRAGPLSFGMASRADLDAAAEKLDRLGVEHDPVKDIGAGFLLEFRDPDGIALELFAAAAG